MPQVHGRQPTSEEWAGMTPEERVAALTPEELEGLRQLVADLPDYILPSYPFDLPPHRMPLAQYVLGEAGPRGGIAPRPAAGAARAAAGARARHASGPTARRCSRSCSSPICSTSSISPRRTSRSR